LAKGKESKASAIASPNQDLQDLKINMDHDLLDFKD
jgi:hypothetical protein